MELSGPLTEILTDEADPSRTIENHSTLPKLTVTMVDDYGAYVPGAPGDMVRLQLEKNVHVLPLGPDGTASFDKVGLAIPAAEL